MNTDILAEVKPFSSEWWDFFLKENGNFTETKIFKSVINDADVVLLNEEIVKILQELYLLKTNKYGFRVYLDGKEQDNTFMTNLFENHAPFDNEDITEYFNRVFSDKKFGMIINHTEKFSEELARHVLLKIQPLLDKVGIPLTGLSAHILIGNYGWTPLGIHQDTRGENVIHFHLGPGPKIMYNWNEDDYKELTGKKDNNKDVEPLLPYAESYPFETGDLYYMPWNKYHIGFSDQFSVGLTIWFNNPTKRSFTTAILDALHLQHLNEDDEILSPNKDKDIDLTFENIKSVLNLNENLRELTFIDLLKYLHKEYKLAILSNGGWASIPVTLSDKIKYEIDNYEILDNKKIITPYPFKTFYEKIDDELVIFARGYKVKIRYHDELINIIDKLNQNKEELVTDLLSNLIVDWPVEAGLYFLSLLYDKRAINIVETNKLK